MSDINHAGSDLIFELEDRPPFHQALVGAITHLLAIFVPMVTPALIVGAADHDAGAALGADHVHDVDLQGLALGVHLAGHLLVAGQNCLAALAQIQCNDPLLGVDTGNRCLHDVVCAGLDLAELLAALGLADALTDDVLCGLGGNAAKIAGLERGDDAVADL